MQSQFDAFGTRSLSPGAQACLHFGPETRVIVEDAASEGERMALDWILNFLEHQLNFRLPVVPASAAGSCRNGLLLMDALRPGHCRSLSDAPVLDRVPAEEGFMISVTAERAAVIGGNSWAVYYGAQELVKLFNKQGRFPTLPQAEVTDAPAFAVRGVLLNPHLHGFDSVFCWKVLAEMSRHRMNCLVLATDGERHDSPTATPPDASGPELEGLLGFAADYGFRIAQQRVSSGGNQKQDEAGWIYLPAKRNEMMDAIRRAARESSPPAGFILETGVPVNELNFSRLGLLSALEALATLCWCPSAEPPPIRPVLSNLILKPGEGPGAE